MKIFASFIFIIITNSLFKIHPVHVSVTNIDYCENIKEYSISIKTFKDDIETVIYSKSNIQLNLGTQNELKNANSYIDKYINSNFNIVFDGKQTTHKLVLKKKEIREDNALWLFYTIEQKKNPSKVKISNTLFNDLYPDQKNLLIFTHKNTKEAFTFDKNKTQSELKISE